MVKVLFSVHIAKNLELCYLLTPSYDFLKGFSISSSTQILLLLYHRMRSALRPQSNQPELYSNIQSAVLSPPYREWDERYGSPVDLGDGLRLSTAYNNNNNNLLGAKGTREAGRFPQDRCGYSVVIVDCPLVGAALPAILAFAEWLSR